MRSLLVAMLIIGLLAGCGTAKKQASPHSNSYHTKSNTANNVKQPIRDAAAVKEHLASLARNVPGVRGVNCVVFGNTAIVGIDVDAKLERSRVGTIKYSVAEALSKDKYGANAIVTADMDINERLREISAATKQGHPIAGFTNELSDIIGRMVPQLPNSVKQMQPPSHTENPKMKKSM